MSETLEAQNLAPTRSNFTHTCKLPGKNTPCMRSNQSWCNGLFRREGLAKRILGDFQKNRRGTFVLSQHFNVMRSLGGGKSGAIVMLVTSKNDSTLTQMILKVYLDAFNEWDDVNNERPFREVYTQCRMSGDPGFNCAACFGVASWPSEWVGIPLAFSTQKSPVYIDARFLQLPVPKYVLYMVMGISEGVPLMDLKINDMAPAQLNGMVLEMAIVWQRAREKLGAKHFAHYDVHPGNWFIQTSSTIRPPIVIESVEFAFPKVTIIDFDLVRSTEFPTRLEEHLQAESSAFGLRERSLQFLMHWLPFGCLLRWIGFLVVVRKLPLAHRLINNDFYHLMSYALVAYVWNVPTPQRTLPILAARADAAMTYINDKMRFAVTSVVELVRGLLLLSTQTATSGLQSAAENPSGVTITPLDPDPLGARFFATLDILAVSGVMDRFPALFGPATSPLTTLGALPSLTPTPGTPLTATTLPVAPISMGLDALLNAVHLAASAFLATHMHGQQLLSQLAGLRTEIEEGIKLLGVLAQHLLSRFVRSGAWQELQTELTELALTRYFESVHHFPAVDDFGLRLRKKKSDPTPLLVTIEQTTTTKAKRQWGLTFLVPEFSVEVTFKEMMPRFLISGPITVMVDKGMIRFLGLPELARSTFAPTAISHIPFAMQTPSGDSPYLSIHLLKVEVLLPGPILSVWLDIKEAPLVGITSFQPLFTWLLSKFVTSQKPNIEVKIEGDIAKAQIVMHGDPHYCMEFVSKLASGSFYVPAATDCWAWLWAFVSVPGDDTLGKLFRDNISTLKGWLPSLEIQTVYGTGYLPNEKLRLVEITNVTLAQIDFSLEQVVVIGSKEEIEKAEVVATQRQTLLRRSQDQFRELTEQLFPENKLTAPFSGTSFSLDEPIEAEVEELVFPNLENVDWPEQKEVVTAATSSRVPPVSVPPPTTKPNPFDLTNVNWPETPAPTPWVPGAPKRPVRVDPVALKEFRTLEL